VRETEREREREKERARASEREHAREQVSERQRERERETLARVFSCGFYGSSLKLSTNFRRVSYEFSYNFTIMRFLILLATTQVHLQNFVNLKTYSNFLKMSGLSTNFLLSHDSIMCESSENFKLSTNFLMDSSQSSTNFLSSCDSGNLQIF